MKRTRTNNECFVQRKVLILCATWVAINQYFGGVAVAAAAPAISVSSVRLIDSEFPNQHYLELIGGDFSESNNSIFKLSSHATDCDDGEPMLKILSRSDHVILASIKPAQLNAGSMYLCYAKKPGAPLQHLGSSSKFDSSPKDDSDFKIYGFRIEASEKEASTDKLGSTTMIGDQEVTLRIFGNGITEESAIGFTKFVDGDTYAKVCQVLAIKPFKIVPGSVQAGSALATIYVDNVDERYYICARKSDGDHHQWQFQGTDPWLQIMVRKPMIPIWISLIIIVTCLCFSALFSGLNLGLMSLDRTDLKILCNTGTETEKRYAHAIQPVRDHGNYLLCSILLGNVLVNSTFTILLDGLTSGLLAVVFSTVLIVIFGEITPQAICSRHGLAVGAKTIWITKAVMLITAPLAWPTSKILDKMLGEEIGNFYNRERLKELVRVTNDINDLDKDEVNVISGVLEMRKKKVVDVMTNIDDAFMLSIDSVLDFATVSEIMKSGFSRIPVYDGDRTSIVTLLYIKDLAFVDPDDNTPLRTLCEFYQNPCNFVYDDITLDIMFKQFKEGNKGHMAFVHRVNNEGDGDPYYETIGLITMEDVIEELIQAEIMDETDVFTDNRKKVRRKKTREHDFTVFIERKDTQRIRISPQLTLATFQYLSTTIDAFKSDQVSETILRRLLNQDIVRIIKYKGKDKNDPSCFIYTQGKPVDYFVLVLEGRVEVQIGNEGFVFESGPFTYFGIQALMPNMGMMDSPQQIMGSLQSLNMDAMLRHTFIPDYSVKAVAEIIYIEVKRPLYLAAKRATLMERKQKLVDPTSEAIDDEVEKLLHSLDEDDQSIHNSVPNLNGVTTPRLVSKAPSPTAIIHENNGPITSPSVVFSPAMQSNNIQFPVQRDGEGVGCVGLDETLDSNAPLLPRSKS